MKRPTKETLTKVAFALALLVVAMIFHRQLVAWFAGKNAGTERGASQELAPAASAGAVATAETYPPAAVDALRSAFDAYDRVRAALAADRLQGVADSARTLGEALRAAAAAMTHDESDAARARAAAASADRIGAATTLEDARKAFADLNRDFLAVTGAAIDHYTCPMHPSVAEKAPGKCPICGMELVAVTRAQEAQGIVTIDEAHRQLIGVRTAPVTVGPMQRSFRAVGRVTYDESALADVNLRVRGWITKLYVNQTGQRVTRGQRLFDLYSPELFNAQQDYLIAIGATGADAGVRVSGLGRAARERLRLLGMSDGQIDAITRSGAPEESVAFASPASGYVIEKDVVEGASTEPGTRLYRIAALKNVWVDADVYEADLANVRVGQHASVTLDYLPGRTYDAKVSYVYPYLDPKTRTGRVRIELANAGLDLRPGMFANVALSSDLGTRVQVPVAAVIYTGPRRIVFVDLGQGRFKPQEVHVGVESDGAYEVLDGLRPGDVVATSGVFLISAQARLTTKADYWDRKP